MFIIFWNFVFFFLELNFHVLKPLKHFIGVIKFYFSLINMVHKKLENMHLLESINLTSINNNRYGIL